jgi:phytoene dehydrogenase-like protein
MDVDVVIVGAGHNGLMAGTYLARAGLRVHLFERRPFAGAPRRPMNRGRASTSSPALT